MNLSNTREPIKACEVPEHLIRTPRTLQRRYHGLLFDSGRARSRSVWRIILICMAAAALAWSLQKKDAPNPAEAGAMPAIERSP